MQVFSFYSNDSRESAKKVQQHDTLVVRDNIFLVADGVTISFVEPYPDTSQKAVHVASQQILKVLQTEHNGLDSIKNAFTQASQAVSQIENIREHYAGLTLAFGFCQDNILYFGQLNDCGIMVLDKFGNREIDFIANQTDFIKHLQANRAKGLFQESSPEEHKYVREEVVNKKYNFGVLNGDPAALNFVRIGATNLERGQTIFFYTDGFIPYVYNDVFIKQAIQANSQVELEAAIKSQEEQDDKFKKERSIIVLKA